MSKVKAYSTGSIFSRMNNRNILITGNSSGLGLGFSEYFLSKGNTVFGMSRRGCPVNHNSLRDICIDLNDLQAIPSSMQQLLGNEKNLDLAILNAGILGNIRDMQKTSIEQINKVMQINVWSNKILLDQMIQQNIKCKQIILISSGAAVSGNRGWGAYALSKATLNMLTQLYAQEMTDSHLCALAPGLVDTAMQDYLCDNEKADISDYPSLQALRDARGTNNMPMPADAVVKIASILPDILQQPSGCFLDIRKFKVNLNL